MSHFYTEDDKKQRNEFEEVEERFRALGYWRDD